MRPVTLALALLAAGLLLAGCGERVDTGKAEREIKSGYEKQVPRADVRSVDCPDEIDSKKGTKAKCRMRLVNGVELDVAVEVTDPDEPRIRWEVTGGTMPGTTVERKAVESLAAEVGERPAGVECPARIPLKAGATVRCTVVDEQGTRYGSTVTVKDETGAFEIVVDDTPQS